MKTITKQIGTSTWEIIYPDDIHAELAKSSKEGYHVSDWAWQHAYCIGINLDTKKEKWLPKNYIDMLLEENARENFMSIYYDPNIKALSDKVQLHRDFNDCWSQLLNRKEKEHFAINCCYLDSRDGGKTKLDRCEIYFHVWDRKEQCYTDLSLEEYRNREKYRYEIWNSIN